MDRQKFEVPGQRVQFSVYLSSDLHETLRAYSYWNRVSISKIVTLALIEFFRKANLDI